MVGKGGGVTFGDVCYQALLSNIIPTNSLNPLVRRADYIFEKHFSCRARCILSYGVWCFAIGC